MISNTKPRIDYIAVDHICPNPDNPRKHFDPEELTKLAQSIREVGMLQPILVVINGMENYKDFPDGENGEYRLVAGERRWRAAKEAGLEYIPAVLKNLTLQQEAEIMLIENLQRKDLDPIEEAQAYHALLQGHGYTQEALGEKLGVSQAHIANRIRLLELPESVTQDISRGIISGSHGKVLAGYKDLPAAVVEKAAKTIVDDQVPVAKTKDTIMKVIAETGKPLFDNYNSRPEFKVKQCEGCQSRVMGSKWSCENPYCMKPSCWEKKQQEAKQSRELALADRVQKAAKKGQGVIELDKFKYDQYEIFMNYKTEGIDLSECQNCEHKKVAKNYRDELVEACFQPSCFSKKKAAAARAKGKADREAFQSELSEIGRLSGIAAETCSNLYIPRPVLIYMAAQVLANVNNNYDRKTTRFQYVKEKFGWTEDSFKNSCGNLLGSFWEDFRAKLESLTDQQMWEIIFEWPAVAEGLTGAREWMFKHNGDVQETTQVPEPDQASPSPAPQKKSYARSSKEISLPTFAKRAGMPAAEVRKMCEKGEITSKQSYKHRLIPESELEKIL